jgi:hypothetical protein
VKTRISTYSDRDQRYVSAPHRAVREGLGPGSVDNRTDAISPRKLTEAINTSPQIAAQRKQLEAMFGEKAVVPSPVAGIIQRVGPSAKIQKFEKQDQAHFDRHLDTWKSVGVRTEEDVEGIAQQLFYLSAPEKEGDEVDGSGRPRWKRDTGKSGYYVDHDYLGRKVRMACQNGGVVTCFIRERGKSAQPQVARIERRKRQGGEKREKRGVPLKTENRKARRRHLQGPPQGGTPQPQGGTQLQPPQPQPPLAPTTVFYKGYTWTADYNQWWDPQSAQWRQRYETIQGQVVDWFSA